MTPENITENLPPLIEYLQLGRCGAISYTDHVTRALADDLQVVRYEDLLTDPLAALFPVFCRFSDHQYDRHRLEQVVSQQSFEAETGRRAGVAAPASYIRKGIPETGETTLIVRPPEFSMVTAAKHWCGLDTSRNVSGLEVSAEDLNWKSP